MMMSPCQNSWTVTLVTSKGQGVPGSVPAAKLADKQAPRSRNVELERT